MTRETPESQIRMVVVAGPNGSGKSTVTKGLSSAQEFPNVYINADDISKDELGSIKDDFERNMKAANLAEQRRQAALSSRQPFAFETVMSTPGKLALIDEAKSFGYSVDLIFITTEDAQINVLRVQNRVSQGGHPVDAGKIAERYNRTMELLPCAVEKSNFASIFDNSTQVVLVAEKTELGFNVIDNSCDWVSGRLALPLKEREESRLEISQSFPNANIIEAYIGENKCYSGEIVHITKHHLLQRKQGSMKDYLLHDKTLCAPRSYQVGKSTAVSYVFGEDGKHKEIKPSVSRQNLNKI